MVAFMFFLQGKPPRLVHDAEIVFLVVVLTKK